MISDVNVYPAFGTAAMPRLDLQEIKRTFPIFSPPSEGDAYALHESLAQLLIDIDKIQTQENEVILQFRDEEERIVVLATERVASDMKTYIQTCGEGIKQKVRAEFQAFTSIHDEWESFRYSVYVQTSEWCSGLSDLLARQPSFVSGGPLSTAAHIAKLGAMKGGLKALEGVASLFHSKVYEERQQPLPFLKRVLGEHFAPEKIGGELEKAIAHAREDMAHQWQNISKDILTRNTCDPGVGDALDQATWVDPAASVAKLTGVTVLTGTLAVSMLAYSALWAVTTVFPLMAILAMSVAAGYAVINKEQSKDRMLKEVEEGTRRIQDALNLFIRSEIASAFRQAAKEAREASITAWRGKAWGGGKPLPGEIAMWRQKIATALKEESVKLTLADHTHMLEDGLVQGEKALQNGEIEKAIFLYGQAFDGLVAWSSKKTGIAYDSYKTGYLETYVESYKASFPQDFVERFHRVRKARNMMIHKYQMYKRDGATAVKDWIRSFYQELRLVKDQIERSPAYA